MDIESDAARAIEAIKTSREIDPAIRELFPHRGCKVAVLVMHSMGYGIVSGDVILEDYCRTGKIFKQPHYWSNLEETGEHFDITASQWNPHLPPEKALPHVYIWKEGEETIYRAKRKPIKPEEVL